MTEQEAAVARGGFRLRRRTRLRRYLAAFSLQLYVGGMFTALAVVRIVEPGGFVGGLLWPAVYVVVIAVLFAGIVRPFSQRLAAASGALIAVVAAARIGGIVELAVRRGLDAGSTVYVVPVALWGLVVVVGLRWPYIAWESGVKHLLDVSRDAPPEPDLLSGER